MNRLYGFPIFIGFIGSMIFPDYSFELNSFALPVLFFLTFITSTRYSLKPFAEMNRYVFSILFAIASSYILTICFLDLLCHLLDIKDSIRMAILVTVAAPFALIAPLFCRKHGSDANLSLLLVIFSTFLSPVLFYGTLHFFDHENLSSFAILPITRLLLILSGIMLCTLLFSLYSHFFSTSWWISIQTKLSSVLIALLVYIFWGQTWTIFNSRLLSKKEILFVVIVMFILDFGLYFILPFLNRFIERTQAHTLRITLSMKNLAIPATLILTYSPNMLFIPAIGFLFHILLFNFLAQIKRI